MPGTDIHPTAIVSPQAELGENVIIGPYAIVEDDVQIGDSCVIHTHAQILHGTRIGMGSSVGRAAILGGDPQSLTFDARTPTYVVIGEHNVIREHVTIHRATVESEATRMGEHNFLMVGSHLGHDTVIGDHNVIANAVLLAGHIQLGSGANLGGGAAFHQYLRIGDYCMAQGNGAYSNDIPPYTTVAQQNQLSGLNIVGLRRAGFSHEERKEIKELYRLVFGGNLNISQGVEAARERQWSNAAQALLDFVSVPTRRGFCTRK